MRGGGVVGNGGGGGDWVAAHVAACGKGERVEVEVYAGGGDAW